MKYYSIIRGEEYKNLSKVILDGTILDTGGSKKSGYHELIRGDNKFVVINIDKTCEPDYFVDIEKKFPFAENQFDHAICLNVLEHVYEFENVFSEQVRCIKSGGKIILATPFMHHIHASPDDYLRYTDSTFKRMAEKYACTIESIVPVGKGLFSLLFQSVGGSIPTTVLQALFKKICVGLDSFLNKISKRYRKLSSRIPLGYFIILIKN